MTLEEMHFMSSADAAKVREPNIQQVPWKFISIATSGLYYKQVTIVIYDRNDSGQYYKTTIMIVIDDPSLS
jgi:hypothetical protein